MGSGSGRGRLRRGCLRGGYGGRGGEWPSPRTVAEAGASTAVGSEDARGEVVEVTERRGERARGASAGAAVDGCGGGHGRSRRRRGQSRRARGGRKSSSSRRSFPSAAVLPSSGAVLPSSNCPCIRRRDEDNKMKTETAKNATERTEIVMK